MKHNKKLKQLIKEYKRLGISKQPGYEERQIQELVDSSVSLSILDDLEGHGTVIIDDGNLIKDD